MPNITLTKTMATISSGAVALVSSAVTPVVSTLNTSNYATQRRLSFWSSVALSSTNICTVVGKNESGLTITESIVPSTVANVANVSTQDFLSVSSVSVSAQLLGPLSIGLSSIGSTPWQMANTLAAPFLIGFNLVYASSGATISGSIDYTFSKTDNVYLNPLAGFVPSPTISTAISTTGVSTSGKIDFPITAWRMTLNSTGNTGLVTLNVVPSGLGS